MASLLEWQVIITAAITKTARKQYSTTTILSFIRGKSLRHVAMVAKNSGSQQNRGQEQKEKIGMTCVSCLCMILSLRIITIARAFLSWFDNANGFLCKQRLLRSRNFATMVT